MGSEERWNAGEAGFVWAEVSRGLAAGYSCAQVRFSTVAEYNSRITLMFSTLFNFKGKVVSC
jgi:hypothetical protein